MEKIPFQEFMEMLGKQLVSEPVAPVVFRGLPLDWQYSGFITNAWEWINFQHEDGSEFLVHYHFYRDYCDNNGMRRVPTFSTN